MRNTDILGSEVNDGKEGEVLNRPIRATEDGWELEADPRHAELIIRTLDLEGTTGVATPGVDDVDTDAKQDEGAIDASKFRSVAARATFLAQDRFDTTFAAKEACWDMPKTVESSWTKAKRIGRHLVRHPRAVVFYNMQDPIDFLNVYADANWAGCKVSRKSTSVGCLMKGQYLKRFWSKTQATIAQSSGESEL